MKRLIGVTICSLLFLGCDIPGRLIITNKTNQTVTLDIGEFRGGGSWEGFDMDSIVLYPSEKQSVYYGFGGFYNEEADSLKKALKSIAFTTDSGTKRVTSAECLSTVLPKKATGLMNSKLKVKIKKSIINCNKP